MAENAPSELRDFLGRGENGSTRNALSVLTGSLSQEVGIGNFGEERAGFRTKSEQLSYPPMKKPLEKRHLPIKRCEPRGKETSR